MKDVRVHNASESVKYDELEYIQKWSWVILNVRLCLFNRINISPYDRAGPKFPSNAFAAIKSIEKVSQPLRMFLGSFRSVISFQIF